LTKEQRRSYEQGVTNRNLLNHLKDEAKQFVIDINNGTHDDLTYQKLVANRELYKKTLEAEAARMKTSEAQNNPGSFDDLATIEHKLTKVNGLTDKIKTMQDKLATRTDPINLKKDFDTQTQIAQMHEASVTNSDFYNTPAPDPSKHSFSNFNNFTPEARMLIEANEKRIELMEKANQTGRYTKRIDQLKQYNADLGNTVNSLEAKHIDYINRLNNPDFDENPDTADETHVRTSNFHADEHNRIHNELSKLNVND
jgi:hypothetical protein